MEEFTRESEGKPEGRNSAHWGTFSISVTRRAGKFCDKLNDFDEERSELRCATMLSHVVVVENECESEWNEP